MRTHTWMVWAVAAAIAGAAGCSESNSPPPASQGATGDQAAEESAAPSEGFSVGDDAPAFAGLIGVDDEKHSLADYADAKAVAVVFTCNHCPVAVAYEDRLNALHSDYADRGVQLVAINVNNMEADKLPAMKVRAEEKGFEFPYLYDPTQQVGRNFGATVTPHAFLLDRYRRLAYVGPIDDERDADKVTTQFLRDAIDATLAGSTPTTTTQKPHGCGIKYE